jgi:tRNA1(Val) A37 N6-methylase TrmN6
MYKLSKIDLHNLYIYIRMTKEYNCSTCLKDFTQKSQYERHINRKNPCKAPKAISKEIKNIIQTNVSFRENSLKLNKELSKDLRQEEGIFFTPKKARDLLFEEFDKLKVKPKNILEPSFGSGEFLEDLKIKYPKAKITGVEYNEKIFKSYKSSNMELIHGDFMKYKSETSFNCIIGNPPYFIIKDKNPNCMIGRPNIYIAFLYKCLEEHLEDKGYLGFILPTSLYNCSYYEPMRKYIYEKCTIHFIKSLDVNYYETGQDTMLIIIQKKIDKKHKYFFCSNDSKYITPFYKELNKLTEETKTIEKLGLYVKTGDVVWNQEKDKLSTDGTLLIYNTNIVNNKLVLNNIKSKDNKKKQYIKGFHKTPIKGRAILVNRGYGNVEYKFNYVCVDIKEFYAENHVNMILAKDDTTVKNLALVEKSFEDERTSKFIQMFVGNGALSKTEIESVLPIFIEVS